MNIQFHQAATKIFGPLDRWVGGWCHQHTTTTTYQPTKQTTKGRHPHIRSTKLYLPSLFGLNHIVSYQTVKDDIYIERVIKTGDAKYLQPQRKQNSLSLSLSHTHTHTHTHRHTHTLQLPCVIIRLMFIIIVMVNI